MKENLIPKGWETEMKMLREISEDFQEPETETLKRIIRNYYKATKHAKRIIKAFEGEKK